MSAALSSFTFSPVVQAPARPAPPVRVLDRGPVFPGLGHSTYRVGMKK